MESTPHKTKVDETLPGVSFVTIGRNEGDRLVRCLNSILAADYPREKIEIIYVDSNSTDESCARAEAIGARVMRVNPRRPTAAIGRNGGWKAARFDLVQFLDGDTILHRDWVRKAVSRIADPGVACVFGRREEMAADATVFNFWAHHDWYVPPGPADSCAGDVLFRKSVLDRAGGYDESLIAGEEPDLCYRIRRDQKLIILSLDDPMTLHDMNMRRWTQYWRRCMRTGHAYAEVGGRNVGMHRWRRARWRNLFHALGTPAAVLCSLSLWSIWPLLTWCVLEAAAWLRNALRLLPRVGTWSGAMSYSLHHYLSKTPAAWGQMVYWCRAAFRREPQTLIEYRT